MSGGGKHPSLAFKICRDHIIGRDMLEIRVECPAIARAPVTVPSPVVEKLAF